MEAQEEFSQALEKAFKVKIAGDLSPAWFLYLEKNSGFFISLIRDARQENPGVESHRRFVDFYLKSLWQGE